MTALMAVQVVTDQDQNSGGPCNHDPVSGEGAFRMLTGDHFKKEGPFTAKRNDWVCIHYYKHSTVGS